jgi:hypothetical protein
MPWSWETTPEYEAAPEYDTLATRRKALEHAACRHFEAECAGTSAPFGDYWVFLEDTGDKSEDQRLVAYVVADCRRQVLTGIHLEAKPQSDLAAVKLAAAESQVRGASPRDVFRVRSYDPTDRRIKFYPP